VGLEPPSPPITRTAPAALFERVVGERIDDDTMQWLIEGFRQFDRHDGALSLERCLRLPTAAQRRLAERDFWIRTIAELIEEPREEVPLAREVARMLSAFITRGAWREWCGMDEPPGAASALQRALFFASRAIRGKGRTPQWRQILRVIGSRCHRFPPR
jgi:hypothetical protein